MFFFKRSFYISNICTLYTAICKEGCFGKVGGGGQESGEKKGSLCDYKKCIYFRQSKGKLQVDLYNHRLMLRSQEGHNSLSQATTILSKSFLFNFL